MNYPQCCKRIAMVRPAAFAYNEETATNNFFQQESDPGNSDLQERAMQQFDDMVQLLESNGIEVLVLHDTPLPIKPDAIFPNNWFSTSNDVITLFPMEAHNRRLEKRPELVAAVQQSTGIHHLEDLSGFESKNIFLEGTGSIVFDHVNKIAYACYSNRTNQPLFENYCRKINYLPVGFKAVDEKGRDIYHTNVMMCVGEKFAVICMDAVEDEIDKKKINHELSSTGHEIIEISSDQMNHFAGNMLEVLNKDGAHFVIMSSTAFNALDKVQIQTIYKYAEILTPDVSIIESVAGGSVRCMMAELFF